MPTTLDNHPSSVCTLNNSGRWGVCAASSNVESLIQTRKAYVRVGFCNSHAPLEGQIQYTSLAGMMDRFCVTGCIVTMPFQLGCQMQKQRDSRQFKIYPQITQIYINLCNLWILHADGCELPRLGLCGGLALLYFLCGRCPAAACEESQAEANWNSKV